MFIVTVKFKIDSDAWQRFLPLMLANAEASLKEDGCHQFDVCIDSENEHVFLFEVYDDSAAFDSHLVTEHFLTFNQKTQSMIKTKQINTYQKLL
ncbi:putative quinol monooxygenase [Vibrio mytili]|uniref:putative quinol monooxygenase n=1 Tax=Vibrio mytili TaxID=50718 RepID=UPI002F41D5DF